MGLKEYIESEYAKKKTKQNCTNGLLNRKNMQQQSNRKIQPAFNSVIKQHQNSVTHQSPYI